MNVQEIADKYKIPLKKLKRLEKDNLLVVTPTDTMPARIRACLSSARPLTVEMLMALGQERKLAWRLGPKYEQRAIEILETLGDVAKESIPAARVPSLIYGASIDDVLALKELSRMVKGWVPPQGCTYHYIACRILWNCPAERFADAYRKLPSAIVNLRKFPEMSGWSSKPERGVTVFHHPGDAFAALDL